MIITNKLCRYNRNGYLLLTNDEVAFRDNDFWLLKCNSKRHFGYKYAYLFEEEEDLEDTSIYFGEL